MINSPCSLYFDWYFTLFTRLLPRVHIGQTVLLGPEIIDVTGGIIESGMFGDRLRLQMIHSQIAVFFVLERVSEENACMKLLFRGSELSHLEMQLGQSSFVIYIRGITTLVELGFLLCVDNSLFPLQFDQLAGSLAKRDPQERIDAPLIPDQCPQVKRLAYLLFALQHSLIKQSFPLVRAVLAHEPEYELNLPGEANFD